MAMSSEAGSVSESDEESTDDDPSSESESVPTSLSSSSSLSDAPLALPRRLTSRVFLACAEPRGLLLAGLLTVRADEGIVTGAGIWETVVDMKVRKMNRI